MFDFLFGVPFYKSKIDSILYNKKQIIDDITENYSIDPNRNVWDDRNGYLHHEYGDAGNPKFKSLNYTLLIPIYKTHLENFFNSYFNTLIRYRFDIANYNCFSAGQHMGVHNHPSCDFSAVHYVQFNKEKHHSTRYYNPADWAYYPEFFSKAMNAATKEPLLKNSWKYNNWNFSIEEDDFVVTPSSLRHSVPASKSKDLRMVIVLNIYIEDAETVSGS